MKFEDILHIFRAESFTQCDKGTRFERLMCSWLLSDPRYSTLTEVWLWEDFPSKADFGGKDTGIDLVARTDSGDYWAIQCKCYNFFVDKMTFPKVRNEAGKLVPDKSRIIYNGNIIIENIPAKAYEYIVNGTSAIEWIMERYAVTKDKKSLIINDPNEWSKEHNNPTYIFDLLLSVINLSVQTVDIVNSLPKLKF